MTMSIEHINLLAALMYRDAADYIETHQCEYSKWNTAKNRATACTKSAGENRQKGEYHYGEYVRL